MTTWGICKLCSAVGVVLLGSGVGFGLRAQNSEPQTSTRPASDIPASRPSTQPAGTSELSRHEPFLRSRLRTGMMLGSFNSMASMWYAVMDVTVSAETSEIGDVQLDSPFPKSYQPTWREYFDAIGRQTGSVWKYREANSDWFFAAPAPPLPYTIKMAPEWQAFDRGQYASYVPPIAPVGMDIYMLGEYSTDDGAGEDALFERVRKEHALRFAATVVPTATFEQMRAVKVDGADALFFEGTNPKSGILWRQWAFIRRHTSFVIVSAIHPDNDARLLPQVMQMVESFQVK